MTINVHPKGTPRRLDVEFRNIAGTLANPDVVKFRVTTPGGVTTEYAVPPVVQESTGKYYYDATISEAGKWVYTGIGTGTVDAKVTHVFFVEPTDFTVVA
jgi:hypothetical protein